MIRETIGTNPLMSSAPRDDSRTSAWRVLVCTPFTPRLDARHGGKATSQLLLHLVDRNQVALLCLRAREEDGVVTPNLDRAAVVVAPIWFGGNHADEGVGGDGRREGGAGGDTAHAENVEAIASQKFLLTEDELVDALIGLDCCKIGIGAAPRATTPALGRSRTSGGGEA